MLTKLMIEWWSARLAAAVQRYTFQILFSSWGESLCIHKNTFSLLLSLNIFSSVPPDFTHAEQSQFRLWIVRECYIRNKPKTFLVALRIWKGFKYRKKKAKNHFHSRIVKSNKCEKSSKISKKFGYGSLRVFI